MNLADLLSEKKTLKKRWKFLAVSVLAAALIALACGQCESPTSALCTKTAMAIASLP